MTPDHRHLIETTLGFAYSRSVETTNGMNIPLGKNPPPYTQDMMWQSNLARDLVIIAEYVEGHPFQGDIRSHLIGACRHLFGNTLDHRSFRLPHKFHRTPLGELFFAAFARYYPLEAFMRTHEAQKLFGVSRQSIYDWCEEGKLVPYYVKGTQMFLRKDITHFHERWLRQKQQAQQKGLVMQLGGSES